MTDLNREEQDCTRCEGWGTIEDGVSKCLHCDGKGYIAAPRRTRIYSDNPGACIEPGGYELDNETDVIDCERCGADAIRRNWETVDGGSINAHWRWWCTHCGASDASMFADDD